MDDIVGIDPGGEMSVGDVAGATGALSSIGGMLSGVAPLAMGLGAVSGMFGDSGKMDISKAESGGTFITGEFKFNKSDGTVLIIIVAVVLGALILFKGKK